LFGGKDIGFSTEMLAFITDKSESVLGKNMDLKFPKAAEEQIYQKEYFLV
jgi:hypothetical protein